MAKSDTPRTHVIQRSPERVACAVCNQEIEEGELRFSEAVIGDEGKFARSLRYARTPKRRELEYDDDDRRDEYAGPAPDVLARYYHLECAAKRVPYRFGPTLERCTLPPDNLDELRELMTKSLTRREIDPAADDDATREQYERFIAQLREATDDEGQAVFGDWLQTVGDPRGELISLQLQIESATGWTRERLVETEKKLLAAHRQLLPDKSDAFTWRRGFVHAISIGAVKSDVKEILEHPSLQLVRELRSPYCPPLIPSTLRVLEIDGWGSGGDLSSLANATQLHRLKLPLLAPAPSIHHPSVVELELAGLLPAVVQLPARKQVPAVRRLILRARSALGELIAKLPKSKLLDGLEELVLHGELAVDDLAPLKKHAPPRLDLRGTSLAPDADVKRYANIVELPAPAVEPENKLITWQVRHTKRPEWGIGRVIEETEQGLQVEFEHAGEKLVRNVELLEDVE